MATSYPNAAQPLINWNHIDGPMLCARSGEIHWLTLWERFVCALGRADAYSLERKRFPHLFAARAGK